MDTTVTKTGTLEEKIRNILSTNPNFTTDANGMYYCEIYADYRDKMSKKTAIEILNNNSPRDIFCETLMELYMDSESWYRNDTVQTVMEELDGEDEDEVREILLDMVYFTYPEDHYLNQKFCVNIMIDTGDGNYDFVLNSMYPHYNGDYETEIEDEASLVWLAGTQGYTKAQLWKALQNGDSKEGFLGSVFVEVANMSSHMSMLIFLVELTLDQLFSLREMMKNNADEGYLVVSKETMTGLYDAWSGGGSILDIQLEKDVKIPFKYIRSVLPDGGDGYSVEGVYGMCDSAWQYGEVTEIKEK